MNKYYQKAIPFAVLFSMLIVASLYLAFAVGYNMEFNIINWPDDPSKSGSPQGMFALASFFLFWFSIAPGVWLFESMSKKEES